ncbi:MAG: hypothetical protein VCE74_00635 [Alphaproteobacteria bacterium]
MAEELKQYVRSRMGKHAIPRQIKFAGSLPKILRGKFQRFILSKA